MNDQPDQPQDERTRLRARAADLGILADPDPAARPLTRDEYTAAVESMRGIGPALDAILDDERGPRASIT
jgi:hypothetical protein